MERAQELQLYRIKDLQEGKDLIEEIEQASRDTFTSMRAEGISNQKHAELTDVLYEFKKARHNIQSQMTSIVKTNMKPRVY